MNPKRPFLPILAAVILVIGCSLTSGGAKTVVQNTNTQSAAGGASSSPSAGQPTGSPETSLAARMKSFPVPPGSTMESNSADSADPDAASGTVSIRSTAGIMTEVSFYETELPKLGWFLRYADPNTACGVTQYWRNDTIYLSLTFRYEESVLTIRGQFNRVDAQSMRKFLPDFPLPDSAELVSSSSTAWVFYIFQDYKAVERFYTQALEALEWTTDGPEEPVEASCGDDDPDCGGGGSSCPAGVEPMPSPTFDLRRSITILYTMPNGNEVTLDIVPHGNATILYVDIMLKSSDSAGLPEDVPIYPGAVLQIAVPGTATFLIDAGLDAVKKFYEEGMAAAGWIPDGNAIEIAGSYLQNWTKGDQKISISILSTGEGCMLVLDCSTCR